MSNTLIRDALDPYEAEIYARIWAKLLRPNAGAPASNDRDTFSQNEQRQPDDAKTTDEAA